MVLFRVSLIAVCIVAGVYIAGTSEARSVFDRSQYRTVIHLYGDSIARGWGMKDFEHSNPLNRIHDIANLLLEEHGITSLRVVSRPAGKLSADLEDGLIEHSDVVVYEDAGQHENDIGLRRSRFEMVTNIAEGHRLILTTTFDYWPPAHYYNYEYDVLIGESDLTMNDLVRQACEREVSVFESFRRHLLGDKPCTVLDWNRQMDCAVGSLRRYGISPMHRDGVHPNVFGNFMLAVSLLEVLDIEVRSWASVEALYEKLDAEFYKTFGWARPLQAYHVESVFLELAEAARGNCKSE